MRSDTLGRRVENGVRGGSLTGRSSGMVESQVRGGWIGAGRWRVRGLVSALVGLVLGERLEPGAGRGLLVSW